MPDRTVRLSVNGCELQGAPGEMLIAATDRAGIYVPRFCYHPKLSVAANCRMCLVDVEGAPKPLPACATPVAEGMKVETHSQRAISAQRATMEFLLINHPLDCPVCDQGGECELQDLAMGFGRDVSRFSEAKRAVSDPDLGPLVSTDMTRCIHCTRCIRFGEEIAGVQELGATGRSEQMEITTWVKRSLKHELSGNVIDVCPVGALNNKPYRFSARAWEMTAHPTVAPHDCVGSALYAHVLRGRVRRIVPRQNEAVNETWISDRDRFSCEGLYVEERLGNPLVRRNGRLIETGWDEALEAAARGLEPISRKQGGAALGALVSPSATCEEGHLLKKLMHALGSSSIDYRLRRRDFRGGHNEPAAPWLGLRFAEVESLDSLLMVGCDLRREAPILAHRVRKAALSGTRVSYLDMAEREYLHSVEKAIVARPGHWVSDLARHAAAALRGERSAVWFGGIALRHPALSELLEIAAGLPAEVVKGQVSEGGNAAGLAFSGALPFAPARGGAGRLPGMHAGLMQQQAPHGLILMGAEPEFDCAAGAQEALAQAGFVVVLNPWITTWALRHANVILPASTYLETAGTFVNGQLDWQSFAAAAPPPGLSRPAWKILSELAGCLELEGFGYSRSDEVLAELRAGMDTRPGAAPAANGGAATERRPSLEDSLAGLELPMYSVDGLVRRSAPLQQAAAAAGAA